MTAASTASPDASCAVCGVAPAGGKYGMFSLLANPRSSYGYLYIGAWIVTP